MEKIRIYYKLKLTLGDYEGIIIENTFDIEELEETPISTWLINEGWYTSIEGWPADYYEIIERRIVS